MTQRAEVHCSVTTNVRLEDPTDRGAWRAGGSHGQRSLAGYSPWGSQRARHDWSDLARIANLEGWDGAGGGRKAPEGRETRVPMADAC